MLVGIVVLGFFPNLIFQVDRPRRDPPSCRCADARGS